MNLDQPLCCLNRKPLRLITCKRTRKLPKFEGIRFGAQRAQRHGQTTPQQQTVKIQREGVPRGIRASSKPPNNQPQQPPSNRHLTHTQPRTRAQEGEEEVHKVVGEADELRRRCSRGRERAPKAQQREGLGRVLATRTARQRRCPHRLFSASVLRAASTSSRWMLHEERPW